MHLSVSVRHLLVVKLFLNKKNNGKIMAKMKNQQGKNRIRLRKKRMNKLTESL